MDNVKLAKYIKKQMSIHDEVVQDMIQGEEYYNGKQDIRYKIRGAIGDDGRVINVTNLPNTKIIDNQYARAVDQKINYLFSKPLNIDVKESIKQVEKKNVIDKAKDTMAKYGVIQVQSKSYDGYEELLNQTFDMKFLRTLNKVAKDVYNKRIGWLYLSTDGTKLNYKKMEPKEIIPIWSDSAEESLDALIRIHTFEVFEDDKITTKKEVYFYTDEGFKVFVYKDTGIGSEGAELHYKNGGTYLSQGKEHFNFGVNKIPFIYFKLPDKKPLISRVKCLQDALNQMLSNFNDQMLEDPRNTILVIKNYDGENLGEFRQNLATYGAIKVTSEDNMQGGVESLTIEVNSENYRTIVELLRKAISENARSLDLKESKSGQSPNMLNIKAMYSDMELDANALELEFVASLEHFCMFLRQIHKIADIQANISFKRNIMINDESMVEMIKNSIGVVSMKTLRAKSPLVDDPVEEEKRIKEEEEERQKRFNDYPDDFTKVGEEDGVLGGTSTTD